MFKKSLAAVALLGAFAGSAFAADVTLYGVVDEGFLYTHKDADKTGVDAVDKLELKSGIQAGSRWGLKGTDVNFQRFPTLDAKKLVNAPKMSAHHRGICHF